MHMHKVMMQDFMISAWQWDFDGNFKRRVQNLTFCIEIWKASMQNMSDSKDKSTPKAKGDSGEVIAIHELIVFPIQYAPPEVVAKLRRRGQVFWKCRNRAYVSYRENDKDSNDSLVCLPFSYPLT